MISIHVCCSVPVFQDQKRFIDEFHTEFFLYVIRLRRNISQR